MAAEESSCKRFNPAMDMEWIEVTQDFSSACSELELGELLHDEVFGLFDAMSAIEMMDPKMDAGMVCNRVQRNVYNLEQAIEKGTIKVSNLTDEERIGVIDDTFCCLVTWLEGHSLAQTVLTNLYLQNPTLISDKVIKALSLVTLRLIEVIRGIIVDSAVFEEEDFQPSTYGYRLDWSVPDSKVSAMLKEIEDESNKSIKSLKRQISEKLESKVDAKNEVSESKISENEDLNIKIRLKTAILIRIKFIRSFHQLLLNFSRPIKDSRSKVINFPEETLKHLNNCTLSTPDWLDTIDLGIKVSSLVESDDGKNHGNEKVTEVSKSSASNESSLKADYPTIQGFDPLINQRLLPPTFPRYAKIRTRNEMIDYLIKLISRFAYLISGISKVTNLHQAIDFLAQFSALKISSGPVPKVKPASQVNPTIGSCVLSRSILQSCYLHQTNSGKFNECIKDAIDTFIRPPGFQSKDPLIVSAIESFTTTCSKVFMSLVIINGHNRARQRDKWTVILEEFSHLQSEADSLDALIKIQLSKNSDSAPILGPGPIGSETGIFCTYILYHVLKVQIKYALSGFELELYSPHEYHYVYWYLYEFLLGWMVSTLTRASNIYEEQSMLEETMKRDSGPKSKKKGVSLKEKREARKKNACVNDRVHLREICYYQALQQLCGGYCKCIGAFKRTNCIKVPKNLTADPNPNSECSNPNSACPNLESKNCCEHPSVQTGSLGSEQIRYEHRFMPFNTVLAPPVVSYGQYQEMTARYQNSAQTSDDLFMIAQHCFEEASRMLNSIPEPNEESASLLKVARTNVVVTKLLLNHGARRSKTYPEYDFLVNCNFPIIRIL